jgi:hypothetical protein
MADQFNVNNIISEDTRKKAVDAVSSAYNSTKKTVTRGYEDMTGSKTTNTDFSRMAQDAIEQIGELLKQGAEFASKAFNSAVEGGKDLIDNISSNAPKNPNNRDRGGRQ